MRNFTDQISNKMLKRQPESHRLPELQSAVTFPRDGHGCVEEFLLQGRPLLYLSYRMSHDSNRQVSVSQGDGFSFSH